MGEGGESGKLDEEGRGGRNRWSKTRGRGEGPKIVLYSQVG